LLRIAYKRARLKFDSATAATHWKAKNDQSWNLSRSKISKEEEAKETGKGPIRANLTKHQSGRQMPANNLHNGNLQAICMLALDNHLRGHPRPMEGSTSILCIEYVVIS
jgi:hypothetical protein